MEFTKKKYKRAEIEDIFSTVNDDFNGKLLEAREEIASLKNENAVLKAQLSEYREKEAEIAETLKLAKEKADEVIGEAELRYTAEIKTLKIFAEKWREYFKYLRDKYPLYPAIKEAERVYSEIEKALTEKDGFSAIKNIDKSLSSNADTPFNPKEKIYEYIKNNVSDGEFDMDKVLNPGDIRLEDICKELGLTEEN